MQDKNMPHDLSGHSLLAQRELSLRVGIVVERRKSSSRWQTWSWKPVSVILGAPDVEQWHELKHGEGWVHYHIGTLPLTLHRKETEAYRINLAGDPPRVFLGIRENHKLPQDRSMEPFLVTVSPHEAQDYLDSGEDIIEGVIMPDAMIAWLQAFINLHHREERFVKRQRRPHSDPQATPFARPPGWHEAANDD